MDIAMPELNGLEATRRILSVEPTAKVIILSAHCDAAYVRRMKEIGVVGFLEKQTSAAILTKAILEVVGGNTFFSPSLVRHLRDDANVRRAGPDGLLYAIGDRLTSRESEVLQLIAEGSANKQIAAELAISIKTVENHRQHLMEKLKVHGTAALTRYAIAAGAIESNGDW
jgi:DNA-binding NarL/FixJ family response regulator